MRRIEQAMCRAMERGENFKRDNTTVAQGVTVDDVPYADVYLHGNRIASHFPTHKELYLRDAGWQSRTTKSRLNALLEFFVSPSTKIVQRDWVWHVTDKYGDTMWHENVVFETND